MIKKIAITDIQGILPEMEKEGIIPSNKITLFAYYADNNILAVTGVKEGKNAYFKMSYTKPEYRNRGIMTKLLGHVIEHCRNRGTKRGYANCTKKSLNIYLSFNGKISKTYKNGITKVVYEIL